MKMTMGITARNEDGLVAIVVSSVIMVILSLITLGFARFMQQEQRQALDRNLSTQAFYAAESAVNDAVAKIKDKSIAADKKTCAPTAQFPGTIDTARDVNYSCLLIDQSPPSLEYSAIDISSYKTIPVQAETGVPIAKLKIAWDDPSFPNTDKTKDPNTTPVFGGCTVADLAKLPVSSDWSSLSPGMVRLDVIPGDPPFSRQGLIDGTLHLFLYPCASGGVTNNTISYAEHINSSTNGQLQGQIVPVTCTAAGSPRDCEITIDMGAAANKQYYVGVKPMYRSAGVSIRAFDAAVSQLAISKSQVLIDATGRVGGVLRRVQVRVPSQTTFATPENAIHTTDSICKLLSVAPANGTQPAVVTNDCAL